MSLTPARLRLDLSTSEYYKRNPEARKRRVAAQARINSLPEEKRRRAALNRERRRRGIAGKGGPDISHTASGGTVLEDPSTNRARNGHGGKPRLRDDAAPKGQPCGASYIPKAYKCSKKGGKASTTGTADKVAKIAAVAGVVAGGVLIAHKWNKLDDQGLAEALQANKDIGKRTRAADDLDPERAELRARREARQLKHCGAAAPRGDSSMGKPLAAARLDAKKACSRTVGEDSAYAQILLHPDGKRVFKVPMLKRYSDNMLQVLGVSRTTAERAARADATEMAINEFQHLELAQQSGVSVPTPYAIQPKTGVISMEYIADAKVLREYNKAGSNPVERNRVRANVLDQMRRLNRAGIAHNDPHPGNFMIKSGGRATVIDFGLATSLKHSLPEERGYVLDNIQDDMITAIKRGVNVHRIAPEETEVFNWMYNRHAPLMESLLRGEATNIQLVRGVDSWYNDLNKALNYKVTRPGSILRLGTAL
jgi:tRNA A-37 threonylcarbamoyl transferase component Bud32